MKPYGVATQQYGAGFQVAAKFDTLREAKQFAARFLKGAAVLCKFSDGRWRKLEA